MAKNGVLIESMIQAKNIDALNRSVICADTNVAGGGLIKLTAPTVQGEDRWTAAVPSAGSLGGLWVAYNPSVKYTEVNGKLYAGLSADDRDYTNIKGHTFDAFKPVKDVDEIVVTAECIDDASNVVVGDILEAKADQTTYTRVAAATGATAGSTAFKVEWIGYVNFPQASIGDEKVKVYKAICVQE